MSACRRRRRSFKTLDDVLTREMITGTAGTSTYDFPVVLNNVLGAKFKLVKGYAGSAALRLAMERGEIEGFCGVGYNSMRTAGLTEGRATILVQIGLAKNPHMPGVPFIMDYAKSERGPPDLPAGVRLARSRTPDRARRPACRRSG